jgi:hypothetical protein
VSEELCQPIPNSIDGSMSLAEVTKSIATAAAKHGWEMKVEMIFASENSAPGQLNVEG